MASRYFQQFTSSLDRNVVILDGSVTLAGAGAPTGLTGKGLSSFVRTSTGVYTLQLMDRYYAQLYAGSSFSAVTGLSGLSDLTTGITFNVNNATPTVTFTFVNDSGVVTDPAATVVLNFFILLKNTFL